MMTNAGQQFQSPISSPMSMYNQQFQQGLQPVVQPVPGSPGVFAVYNPMTGQSSFVLDNSAQQQQESSSARRNESMSPPPAAASYQRQFAEPSYPLTETRSRTDAVLAEAVLDELVVVERDALAVDLAVVALVDELANRLEVGLAVGDVGLDGEEHLRRRMRHLDKDA